MKRFACVYVLFCALAVSVFGNSSPSVSNVTVSQRTDGSKLVDIRYNVSDAEGDKCTISVQVSNDGGSTWTVPAASFTGAIGANVSPGTGKLIVWDCSSDLPGAYSTNCRVKVTADDGVFPPGPASMVWVSINDPGVSGHEGFTGQMSKYETTNAQYCEFLNAAKVANEITVYNNIVYAINDTSHSQPYFDTYTASSNSQITYSGSIFDVRSRDGYDMSSHPVVAVTWYGAFAFCNYYGYRLPTEWEWQAVADYDGSYVYGCGTTIDYSKANYDRDNPLGLSGIPYTTPVGYFPAYGHGLCDMAGNVFEWTSSCYYPECSSGQRVCRGGWWPGGSPYCTVSYRYSYPQTGMNNDIGFRACR